MIYDLKKQLLLKLTDAIENVCRNSHSISTPCRSTPGEITPESSPVKMRLPKSVPTEKDLDFLPPWCVLVILVSPREILNY